ncbi:MAG: hypothetical protein DHS20C20_08680 [Ardenticatenaceae bacterium]|nr:MAG: hypothetical protein DHS20C20_08680 [Ardenticatenaceae bacterium]
MQEISGRNDKDTAVSHYPDLMFIWVSKMQKQAILWKKISLAITFISFALIFVLAILQERYEIYFDIWFMWPILSLLFGGSMIMSLIKGGQAKIKESNFENSKYHDFDQLVGKFMVIAGYLVIGMMLLGICAFFAS